MRLSTHDEQVRADANQRRLRLEQARDAKQIAATTIILESFLHIG